PANGYCFVQRVVDGAPDSTTCVPGTLPVYLRVVRTGAIATGQYSSDGLAWTTLGTYTNVTFDEIAGAGMIVTSGQDGTLTTATFDHVNYVQTGDLGAVPFAGSASELGGVYTVTGSGADIWSTSDQFRFAYQTVIGDATTTARLAPLWVGTPGS